MISKKPRPIAQITSFSKNSAPRVPIKIHEAPFNALFEIIIENNLFHTGAARSLLHLNVFNKIVSEQISLSDKTNSWSSH